MSKTTGKAIWTETTLGQVATLVMGKTPPRSEKKYWTDELTHPFCTIADMEGKWIHPQREGVTPTAIQNSKARKVAAGSLMMSFKLTIGRVGFAGVDLYPNEAIVAIDVDANISTKEFLYLVLGSQDLTHGSGRAIKGATLNSASLAAIPLLLPPIAEQKRIVDVMASVDAYIAALQQQAANSRTARNAVLHELLTAGGEEWTKTTLGKVVSVRPGFAFKSELFSETSGVPLIRIRDLQKRTWTESMYSGEYDNRYLVQKGDFLIGMDGEFQCYEWLGETSLLNQRVCMLHDFDKEKIVPRLVFFMINFQLRMIEQSTSFTTVKHISAKQIEQIVLSIPSLNKQHHIVDTVESIDEAIRAFEQTLLNAQRLRSGLLSNLLSGDHEIPESYDRLLGAA